MQLTTPKLLHVGISPKEIVPSATVNSCTLMEIGGGPERGQGIQVLAQGQGPETVLMLEVPAIKSMVLLGITRLVGLTAGMGQGQRI